MTKTHAKVIVNPAAGARSTRRKWPLISRLLERIGLSFDFQYTEGAGHAVELARAAASNGYNQLVAVGGDGTINEVANGLIGSRGAGYVCLGVISTGTGSDFARSAGIPRHYVDACQCLTSPRRSLIDVGVVKYQSRGKPAQRFFVNMAGVGFDAAVVQNTERFPKYFGGTIPYLAGLARTLFGYRNKSVVMGIGDDLRQVRVLNIAIANGSYVGGGMHIAPDASLNDGLLDVVTIGDIGKFELVKSIPMVYKGTHVNHPKVRIEKAVSISIESPEHVLVYADGELLGEGPARFSVMPAALNIIA